jgi:acetylglutamate kinase
MTMKSP